MCICVCICLCLCVCVWVCNISKTNILNNSDIELTTMIKELSCTGQKEESTYNTVPTSVKYLNYSAAMLAIQMISDLPKMSRYCTSTSSHWQWGVMLQSGDGLFKFKSLEQWRHSRVVSSRLCICTMSGSQKNFKKGNW